ncbi:hypothetical protein Kisp01_27710 [Kineosporia sp. NBRC 101677]|uniref:hypothetical protein n=1 Tax=Kineosporia sp. NBRC 101677 TaxID=3032197 RepID=UPI0024A18AF2|nr:hypothetical protein [Kineosporia sp. NBRC 101677]GLY15756.1 hypothetical protein Kisp01_27710 [Kineosporia sp. NBRC 101677]
MREVQHEDGHLWQKSSVVDEEAVDHERQIALVEVTGEVVRVRVAQRVDFDLLADPITARVSPPRITVGGAFEMTGAAGAELGRQLLEAGRFAEEEVGQGEVRSFQLTVAPAPRPRLVVDG